MGRMLGFRFAEKAAFGSACMTLTREGIEFTLAGFQTIVVSEEEFRRMGLVARSVFDVGPPKVQPVPIERHGKRPPPPGSEEARRLLRAFTKS